VREFHPDFRPAENRDERLLYDGERNRESQHVDDETCQWAPVYH